MEIKTSSEILNLCAEGVRNRLPKIKQSKIEKKKWVVLEDIFDEVRKCQKERVSEADILWNLLIKLRNGGK